MTQAHADTEQALADYKTIDTWSNGEILSALLDGQDRAIAAVRAAIPEISRAADRLAASLGRGGRLFYAGAGTSIRTGVCDGSELPSTFGMAEDRIGYLIAGGRAAMFDTLADAEDDEAEGEKAALALNPDDTLVAITASGTTRYTVAAARCARERGAGVIAVVNNPHSPLAAVADVEIWLNSGPEVIAGSTRMGAGTAQKAALNLLSTLTHIRLGAVHNGMMVNVQAGNFKLRQRAHGIVAAIAGAGDESVASALETTGGEVKPAVLICAGVPTIGAARQRLAESNGNLRQAMAQWAAAQVR